MDEKLVQAMQEARFISAADNVIFPVLKKFREDRVELMCNKFRAGEINFATDIAYIAALADIADVLKKKQTAGNREIEKINKQLEDI